MTEGQALLRRSDLAGAERLFRQPPAATAAEAQRRLSINPATGRPDERGVVFGEGESVPVGKAAALTSVTVDKVEGYVVVAFGSDAVLRLLVIGTPGTVDPADVIALAQAILSRLGP